MSERLATTIALYAVFMAGWAVVSELARRERRATFGAGVFLLELALVAQALLAGVALLAGQRPAEPATFGGYLAVSIAILPAVARRTGPTARDALAVAIACVALAVVCWRLTVTWGTA